MSQSHQIAYSMARAAGVSPSGARSITRPRWNDGDAPFSRKTV